MERFLIKREPYVSQEIEEIVSFDNQSLTCEKPSNIKLEYNDSDAVGIMLTCSENYFEIKQELDSSFEDHPMHEVENVDTEEIVDIVNHSLIDEKLNNIKLDIDQNTSSVRMFSGKYSDIKQELDYSRQDHSICDINEASSVFYADDSLSKLRNAKVVLERLSIVQILEYTKKSEKGSECTYSMSVDALKYVCKRFCLKCDSTFDTAIQHIINHQKCGGVPTMVYYQCMRCNKHFRSYTGIQNHIMTIKTSCKFGEKRFLHLEEFNNDECKKLDCPKCNVSLENVAQFVKHVNDCKEVPKFWCSLCGQGIRCINYFRAHLKSHVSQSTQSTIGFSTKESTQNECDRQERKPIALTFICCCSACNKTFVRHGLGPSNCKNCGTSYTYRCLKCGKEYSNRKSIKGHIDSACNTSKDYRCLVCKQKEFSSLNTLKRHMSYCGKTQHLDCKFCSYKTKHSQSLQRHLHSHFEIKDSSFIDQNQDEGRLVYLFCEQCNNESEKNSEHRKKYYYCFKCNSRLLQKCRRCNVVYKSNKSMTAHIKSNCRIGLQKCPTCGRHYKNLNLHSNCQYRIMHCAHCPFSTKYRFNLIRHVFHIHEEREVSK